MKKFFAQLLCLFIVLPALADNPHVLFKTSMGDVELELYQDKAPVSVANFLKYVKDKQYNGTLFHRVIPGFMVQGGGLTADMAEKPTRPPIKNEADNGLKNMRGSLAMARMMEPGSASAQFFINVNDNASLDHRDTTDRGWGYAVFGQVVKGMDVVDKIVAVPTGNVGMFGDVPKTPIIIKEAKVVGAVK